MGAAIGTVAAIATVAVIATGKKPKQRMQREAEIVKRKRRGLTTVTVAVTKKGGKRSERRRTGTGTRSGQEKGTKKKGGIRKRRKKRKGARTRKRTGRRSVAVTATRIGEELTAAVAAIGTVAAIATVAVIATGKKPKQRMQTEAEIVKRKRR